MEGVNDIPELLSSIYYDPKNPAAYSSLYRLFNAAKGINDSIRIEDVKNWLKGQDVYTQHKPTRKKYRRRITVVRGIDDTWQLDLVVLTNIARYNSNFGYLLTAIDVFSRFAFAEPIKRKSGAEVTRALETIIAKSNRLPRMIFVDKGSEFYNSNFTSLLSKKGIGIYSINSEMKASVIERFNRTLLSKLFKYFTKTNTRRFIEVLPDFMSAYNSSKHRTIGMAPENVSIENEERLWRKLYARDLLRRPEFKYKLNDRVRISKVKGKFEKGYLPGWSDEHFIVVHRRGTNPPTYKLKDLQNTVLKGSFYESEIQKISTPSDDDRYQIEIIRSRKRKGKIQHFVHYKGWPDKFDEWIDAEQISSI